MVMRIINPRMNPVITTNQNREGFTLIEVLIYISLFSLVAGGLLLTTYVVIENSGRIENKVIVSEEGSFLVRKFDWALTGASSITTSSVFSEIKLEVTKPTGESPVVFSLGSEEILMKRGGGETVPLSSAGVSVTSLIFTRIPPAGGKPAAARIEFTLKSGGYGETFSFTKYLKV